MYAGSNGYFKNQANKVKSSIIYLFILLKGKMPQLSSKVVLSYASSVFSKA